MTPIKKRDGKGRATTEEKKSEMVRLTKREKDIILRIREGVQMINEKEIQEKIDEARKKLQDMVFNNTNNAIDVEFFSTIVTTLEWVQGKSTLAIQRRGK